MVEAYWTDVEPDFTLYCGDNRVVIPQLDAVSVDAIVTDPPYELGFMGKGWDRSGIAYDVDVWRECLRVLKPGGHLLAFGGSRTYHRLACAIEDAGFEIRDQIQWIYGSGFPKSLDVGKAIDAAAGATREVVGLKMRPDGKTAISSRPNGFTGEHEAWDRPWKHDRAAIELQSSITAPVTDGAKQWDGWGTALKPAHEPIVLARKPLIGTVAENVLRHGTGGLNIDGCRIATNESLNAGSRRLGDGIKYGFCEPSTEYEQNTNGRWPANVIHDGSEEVVSRFPETASGDFNGHRNGDKFRNVFSAYAGNEVRREWEANEGSAARFFYCAKASQEDRNEGLEGATPSRAMFAEGTGLRNNGDGTPRNQTSTSRNVHPTVKPTDLMRYLCRLITPPRGLVLDPFCGSGSTGKAARAEGFRFIGIEISEEYCALAAARCEIPQRSLFGE